MYNRDGVLFMKPFKLECLHVTYVINYVKGMRKSVTLHHMAEMDSHESDLE